MQIEPVEPIQSPADAIHWRALNNDLLFGMSVAFDLGKADGRITAPVMEAFYRYLALYAVEGTIMLRKWGDAAKEALATTPIEEAQAKRARLSIKIFEGRGLHNPLPIDNHLARLDNESIVSRFSPDMYLDYYNELLIGTSHSTLASFGGRPQDSGFGWEEFQTDSLALGKRIAGLGQFALVDQVEARQIPSCITSLESRELQRIPKSSYFFYRQQFRSVSGFGLRAILVQCQSIVNFALLILSKENDVVTREAALKIHFLSLYGAATTLRSIRRKAGAKLNSEASLILDRLLDNDNIRTLTSNYPMDSSARILRNSLVHYGSQIELDESRLDINKLLFGYVEASYQGSLTGPEFQGLVAGELRRFSGTLEEWSRLPGFEDARD